MKKNAIMMTLACGILCTFTSCNKNGNSWDDSKSSASFRYRNAQSLWGGGEQDQIADAEYEADTREDFVPLRDEDLKSQFADGAVPQSRYAPGEGGVPSVDQFRTPSADLAAIFRNLHFNTDEHTVRSPEELAVVERMASYLKSHPNTYIVVEGHADERGPEAYNLSLGARRANSVRALLVKRGVDMNQIHTISYGKEKPVSFGHSQESWAKNRRAEFKIHQR